MESWKHYIFGFQRLGLAQAIMENPKILILDEPFNWLDKDGVKEMREYLLSYKEQGKTILICFHSAEDISVLCDTVHEMDKRVISRIRVWVNLLFTVVTPPSGASDRKVMWVQVPSSAP